MEYHNEESCIVDGAVVSSGHSTTTFLSRKVLESNPKALHVYNNAPSHKFNKIFSSRTMKKNIKDQKNIFKKRDDLSNTQLSDDLKKAHDQIKVLKKINENLIKENKSLKTKNLQQNRDTQNKSDTFSMENISEAISELNIPCLVKNKLLQQKQNQRHGNSEIINMQFCQNVASSIPKTNASDTFPALEAPSSENFPSLQVNHNYLSIPVNPQIASFEDIFIQ